MSALIAPAAALDITAPRARWALALPLMLVAAWVLLGATLNTAQWGDHFEQFVWAHGVEWGYYKHPPLPTWLLSAAINVFGPSPYWAYVLAGLCTAGTAAFTYLIARRLLGEPLAALALLLWGLQQAFSTRAQLFNHNTVMMLTISAAAWCVLQALHSTQRRWWAAAGVAAGLAMLSKYQAVVPLAGIAVALLLAGELVSRRTLAGVVLAAAVAALVFAPHLLWMLQHDFSTLRYASQEGRALSWGERGSSVVSFLAQQVRLLFPALLFALLLWLLPGLRKQPGSDADDAGARRRRAWFIGLIVFPLGVTLLTCPAFGLKLQNHWGYQCLQFVSLWLAWRLRGTLQRGPRTLVVLALAVQALSMTVAAKPSWTRESQSGRRIDVQYPARQLAAAVQADWRAVTDCPLRVVVGPSFEAGMVSVYAAQPPKVLEGGDFRKSPWIQPDEPQRHGAVYVATEPSQLPSHAVRGGSLPVGAAADGARVYWSVVPPQACDTALAGPVGGPALR
ncbi:MAG TPA: glycosyltransferase family 39 protein [Burkholderiaceae bacterium]|nr:glycosyltransferase family 39 protein [Burkholderiaceae bacterium]